MKKLIYIFLMFLAPAAVLSQPKLDVYLKTAADSSLELRAKFLDYLAAAEKAEGAASMPDPQLAFGWFASPVETRVGPQRAKISLKQRFPWFGKLQNREDHQAELARVKYAEFEDLRQELFLKVRTAWYELYMIRIDIENARKRLRLQQSALNIANKMYAAGEYPFDDLIDMRNDMAKLRTWINSLDNESDKKQAEFNRLLSREASRNVEVGENIPRLRPSDEYAAILDSALSNNSRLSIYRARQESARKAIESARSEVYPDITLGLDYVITGERGTPGIAENGKDAAIPMLSINIPLFRDKYDAEINEAYELSRSASAASENAEVAIRSDIQQAISDYETAQINIELYKELISKTELRIKTASARSAAGADVYKLLRLRELLIRYDAEYRKYIAQSNIAVFRIERILSNVEI